MHNAIAYFVGSQEFMSEGICCMGMKTVLEKHYNQNSIRDGLGGALGNRNNTVKQYKKYEHEWKK